MANSTEEVSAPGTPNSLPLHQTLCGESKHEPENQSATDVIASQGGSHHEPTLQPSETVEPPSVKAPPSVSEHPPTLMPPEVLPRSECVHDQTLMPAEEGPSTRGEASEGGADSAEPATAKKPHRYVIAGYEVIRELDRGGMGVVYKAKQPGLNRVVALKMILSGKGSKRDRDLFKSEAEVIAKLQHPNIVQIYEIGEHDGSLFFSLEFVEGGCLADIVSQQLPTPRQSAQVMLALAEGMDAAHSQGIIHRDLKPANVLLGGKAGAPLEELIPKITDFGLAKLVVEGHDEKHQVGAVMGTPSYMPPEQAEGRNWQIGPPADIYSLGAVLYDMLVGTPPFRGKTLAETLELVCTATPRPPVEQNPAVPEDLQIICLKCLEKEPGSRYRSARELALDLRAFLDGEPISARNYTKWERTKKWVRRHPTRAALCGVSVLAVLLLAIGGVLIALQQSALAREETARASAEEGRRKDAEYHARKEVELRKNEETERKRAEDNFLVAIEANSALTKVGHKRLSNVPHAEGVRRELLEQALAFNERFLVINGNRPSQRHEVGRAHLRVGEIQEMLGEQKAAEKAYRLALKTFTALAAESLDQRAVWKDLAATWNDLAILQQAKNEYGEAEKSFQEALALKKKLADQGKESAETQRDLANSFNSRGHLMLAMKEPVKAAVDYQEALRLLNGLPREQCLEELARTHNNLGAVALMTDPVRAAAEFEASRRLWSGLAKRMPGEPNFKHELATAQVNRGTAYHKQPGKRKEAEADYQRVAEQMVELTSQFKGVLSYRELLANTYHNYGQLLREENRHADSEKVWRAALPLWRGLVEDLNGRPADRQKLGQTLNELAIALASSNAMKLQEAESLFEEAIEVQEKLVSAVPREPAYWLDLINSRDNLAGLLKALPTTERTEKACRELVAVQARRNEAFPKTASYVGELAAAHSGLAELMLKSNRLDSCAMALADAVRYQKEAQALETKNPIHVARLRDYALVLVHVELQRTRHAEVKRLVTELSEAPVKLPSLQSAMLLAHCTAAARKDEKLAEAEREKAALEYGKDSVTYLQKAVAEGFKDGSVLREKVWDAVREREDFRGVVKGIDRKR